MADGPNPEICAYRFMGQEWDAELSLCNFRARMYDPVLRRFFVPDMARQFPSPYVFCGNNPLDATDPSGDSSLWARIGIGLGMALTILAGVALSVVTLGAAAPAAAAADAAAVGAGVGGEAAAGIAAGVEAGTEGAAAAAARVEKARPPAEVLPQPLKLPRKEALPVQGKSAAVRLLAEQTEGRLRRPQRRLPAAGSQRATWVSRS